MLPKTIILMALLSCSAQAATYNKIYDSREPLAEYPDIYPEISSVNMDAKFTSDAQYFRGGLLIKAETGGEYSGHYTLFWTDGEQTIPVIPPVVSYNGKEYSGNNDYEDPIVFSYASDGEHLFMQVWYWAPDYTVLSSFLMFDGREFHTIQQDLLDLPFYDGKGTILYESTGPIAHNMTAANGRAVFNITYTALQAEDGDDGYKGIIYYDGEKLVEIMDNRDPYPVEQGYLTPEEGTQCLISEDGDSFIFTADFGDNYDDEGLFYCDLESVETVYLNDITEYMGTPIERPLTGPTPVLIGEEVIFYVDSYDPQFFRWTPDDGIELILTYDLDIWQEYSMTYAGSKVALSTAEVQNPEPSGDDLEVVFEYNTANSEIEETFYDGLYALRYLGEHGYVYGTNGEKYASYLVRDEDNNEYTEIWATFTPELDIPDGSSEPEPEPEPEPTSNIFSFLDHYSGWFYGNFGWMYDTQYPWVYSLQFESWLYILPDDNVFYFFYSVEEDNWYLATLGNWGWLYTFPPAEPEGWEYVGY